MHCYARPLTFITLICCITATNVAIAEHRLAKKVEIRRTEYGIPHILADNERALGFGLGYAQAEDHMVTIMKLIIRARGESAKYLEPTEANIKADFLNKQYRG